jgi:hypothetical protein
MVVGGVKMLVVEHQLAQEAVESRAVGQTLVV